MTEWILCEDELPPKDGFFEVTNNPKHAFYPSSNLNGVIYYDGIGFLFAGAYRPVKYWREYKPIEKRYGKQR